MMDSDTVYLHYMMDSDTVYLHYMMDSDTVYLHYMMDSDTVYLNRWTVTLCICITYMMDSDGCRHVNDNIDSPRPHGVVQCS